MATSLSKAQLQSKPSSIRSKLSEISKFWKPLQRKMATKLATLSKMDLRLAKMNPNTTMRWSMGTSWTTKRRKHTRQSFYSKAKLRRSCLRGQREDCGCQHLSAKRKRRMTRSTRDCLGMLASRKVIKTSTAKMTRFSRRGTRLTQILASRVMKTTIRKGRWMRARQKMKLLRRSDAQRRGSCLSGWRRVKYKSKNPRLMRKPRFWT